MDINTCHPPRVYKSFIVDVDRVMIRFFALASVILSLKTFHNHSGFYVFLVMIDKRQHLCMLLTSAAKLLVQLLCYAKLFDCLM
jgi:hypothetical protein